MLTKLDMHNERVNKCRRYMAHNVEMSTFCPQEYDPWAGKCRSSRWGKRGRGRPGQRAQRLACDSRAKMTEQRRKRGHKAREWARVPYRIRTSLSAERLLEAQEYSASKSWMGT